MIAQLQTLTDRYPPTYAAFLDPNFSANYVGATNAGLVRGAYHPHEVGAWKGEYRTGH